MVNIVIPLYKGRDTLERALKSLENQTKKMFMITLVQDCDGEDYSDIIEKCSLKVNLIQAELNGGPGMARQIGIDTCPCEFIMFLDADDMLQPRAVEVLTREIQRGNYDVVSAGIIRCQKDRNDVFIRPQDNGQWCHSRIYRVSFLRNNNIRFWNELRANEDSYFHQLLLVLGRKNHAVVEEYLYLWINNPNSITNNDFTRKHIWEYIKGESSAVFQLLSKDPEYAIEVVPHCLSKLYQYWEKNKELNGEFGDCEKYLQYLLLHPLVQQFLSEKKNINKIIPHIFGADVEGEDPVFFSENFPQWYESVTNLKLSEV